MRTSRSQLYSNRRIDKFIHGCNSGLVHELQGDQFGHVVLSPVLTITDVCLVTVNSQPLEKAMGGYAPHFLGFIQSLDIGGVGTLRAMLSTIFPPGHRWSSLA